LNSDGREEIEPVEERAGIGRNKYGGGNRNGLPNGPERLKESDWGAPKIFEPHQM
jgi:hypothetical protein